MKAKNFLIVATAAGLMPAGLIAQQTGGEGALLKGRLEKQLAEISALDAEIQSLSQLLGREGTPLPRREPAKPAPPPELVPETPVAATPTGEAKPPVFPPVQVTPPAPEPQVRTAIPVDEPPAPPRVAPPAAAAVPAPPVPVPVPVHPVPPAPPTIEPPVPPVVATPPDVPVPPVELPKPGPQTLVDEPDPVLPPPLPHPAATATNGKEYTVQAGDSFSSIARKTKVSVSALIKANPNVIPEKLQLGQKLQMPSAADLATTATPRQPEPVVPETPRTDAPPPVAQDGYHVIQSGDTLHGIAQRSGTTVDAISKLNGITNPAALKIGTKLKLPPGSKHGPSAAPTDTGSPAPAPATPRPSPPGSHVVKPGETLYSIARKTGTPIEELRKVNGLKDDTIHPGQSLKVRRGNPSSGADDSKPATTPVIKPAKPVTSTKSTMAPAAKASNGNGVQMTEYTVADGDSLFSIARRHFLSREELAAINSLPVDLPLHAGQKIRLPVEAVSSREMAENESKLR